MQVDKVLQEKITKVNEKICMISYKFFCSLKKKVFLEAKKSKRCFFCNFKKKTKFAQKDDILCWCFLSKNTKQHNFVFCGLNQHFVFFHFFLPMIKNINTFFFTSVFANSKNHHPLFRLISSKRRVSFKQRFAIPKHAYVFWELFTVLVAFFTHKMFVLLCHGQMLSCDKTQLT